MIRRRVVAGVLATALVVVACSSDPGSDADETTRNVSLTTGPVKAPVTTKPSPFTTTLPPSPNPSNSTGGAVITATTTASDRLRGASAQGTGCWLVGVEGDLSRPGVSLPYSNLLPGQSGAGVEAVTTCDPTAYDARSDDRVLVLPIGVPAISNVAQVGATILDVTSARRRATNAGSGELRVVITPPTITDGLRAAGLGTLGYEYIIRQATGDEPMAAPALLTGQQVSGTVEHSGRLRSTLVDSCFLMQVRVTEDRSALSRSGAVRAASDWSEPRVACVDPPRDDDFVLVAFGDSYGSGEGNPGVPRSFEDSGCWSFWAYDDLCVNQRPFEDSSLWDFHELGANELVWGTANACHRSSESGIAKAVRQLTDEWTIPQGSFYFGHFACSGAKSQHIVNTSYAPDWTDGYPCAWTNPGQSGTCRTMPPQITQARRWLTTHGKTPSDVDVVVVSIGGNNAGFADLVASCFVLLDVCNDEILSDPSLLNDLIRAGVGMVATPLVGWFFPDVIPTWKRAEQMAALRAALRSVATAARAAFPRASIMFTTYTDGISVDRSNPADRDRDGACSEDDFSSSSPYPDDWNWTISAESSLWLQGVMREINGTIKNEVSRLRGSGLPVQVVSEQTDNHTNNGFCTGLANSSIVFSDHAAITQGDDISDIADLSSGGWHPTDLGYQFYGQAIAKAVGVTPNFLRTWPMSAS